MPDLLERFQFTTDEVDNQMTHYSLLELIIDRLLLLIYLSGACMDTTLAACDIEMARSQRRKNSNSKVTHLNAGLAIKKYWNKFTQMMSTVRQLNSQVCEIEFHLKFCDFVCIW